MREEKTENVPEKESTEGHIHDHIDVRLPLRLHAQIHYCYLDQGLSIARLASQPPFDSVPIRTLEYWSTTDRWTERRRQAQEEWAARVQRIIGDRVVQRRIEVLESLERIEQEMLEEVRSGRLRFRSLEGAIHSLVRLVQLSDNLRENVLANLTAARSPVPDNLPAAKLTTEEAIEATKAIMAMRHGVRTMPDNDLEIRDPV